jgi:hypothetical protein
VKKISRPCITPDWGAQQRAELADGRRQRAQTFRPKKGKGSYVRKPKHTKS